jgi:hypothetical protein
MTPESGSTWPQASGMIMILAGSGCKLELPAPAPALPPGRSAAPSPGCRAPPRTRPRPVGDTGTQWRPGPGSLGSASSPDLRVRLTGSLAAGTRARTGTRASLGSEPDSARWSEF